jgi:hypothetical protein
MFWAKALGASKAAAANAANDDNSSVRFIVACWLLGTSFSTFLKKTVEDYLRVSALQAPQIPLLRVAFRLSSPSNATTIPRATQATLGGSR